MDDEKKEDTIPGTTIPREINDLSGLEGEKPQDAATMLTDEKWAEITARMRERSRAFETAYKERIRELAAAGASNIRECTAVEASALTIAAGHLAALAGMPKEGLVDLFQSSYMEGQIAVLAQLLKRDGFTPGDQG